MRRENLWWSRCSICPISLTGSPSCSLFPGASIPPRWQPYQLSRNTLARSSRSAQELFLDLGTWPRPQPCLVDLLRPACHGSWDRTRTTGNANEAPTHHSRACLRSIRQPPLVLRSDHFAFLISSQNSDDHKVPISASPQTHACDHDMSVVPI